MDNRTIIFNERIRLLDEGLLEPTGRKTTITTDDGEVEIDEPEPIYTLQEWGRQGYTVVKGQHAVAVIEIWIPRKKDEEKKKKTGKETESKEKDAKEITIRREFVKKKAYFFKKSQVKKSERDVK